MGGGAGNTVNNAQAQNFALVGLPAVEESVAKVENAPREGGVQVGQRRLQQEGDKRAET